MKLKIDSTEIENIELFITLFEEILKRFTQKESFDLKGTHGICACTYNFDYNVLTFMYKNRPTKYSKYYLYCGIGYNQYSAFWWPNNRYGNYQRIRFLKDLIQSLKAYGS